jgi:2-polyprenyl-3-methyl-5-hydroxy-6-metoxy-1,4-benzoquinol methylase
MDEGSKLEQIGPEYRNQDLLGLNELYHLAMRDQMIAPGGGDSALEIGCGAGSWTRVLCMRYTQVDVVDGSSQLLEQVASENAGAPATLTTHHALIEDFERAPDRVWQHIYMTFLLEHLVDPVSVLRQIGQWLTPGGMLCVAVPNADSLHRVLAFRMGLIQSTDELSANDHRVGHRRVYTRSLLRDHLQQAGYKITKELSIGLKPFTLMQMEHLPADVGKALAASGDLVPDHGAYLGVQAGLSN